MPKKKKLVPPALSFAVPALLEVPPDPLRLRVDFHNQAVSLTTFTGDVAETKLVSALDVAHALASELSYSTGILPENVLWWTNTTDGPVTALYEAPRIRRVALQDVFGKPPKRFTIPLPGLVFLCTPGHAPAVYAVKHRPTKKTDEVYHAPLCNVYETGETCPGNHKYPTNVGDTVESFFQSFFTRSAKLGGRSKKYEHDVSALWKWLDKKKEYPLDDLVQFGTVSDIAGKMKRRGY